MTAGLHRWAVENVRTLERRPHVAPLGIRFWDVLRDTQVSDNLIVRARRDYEGAAVHDAFRTAGGIYAFRDLPGLYDLEYPAAGGTQPPGPIRFIISVDDRLGRFVPEVFPVNLPLPRRGVYPLNGISPPETAPPGIFVFSSASRAVVSGVAAVRGQLHDIARGIDRGVPAAHAWVEVRIAGGEVWRGLSDRTGAFAVLFPYPRARVPLAPSPPQPPRPLASQRWSVTIRTGYEPATLLLPSSGGDLPLLKSILDQPRARLWARTNGPPAGEITAELTYGRELILRTAGDPESRLWIAGHRSPP